MICRRPSLELSWLPLSERKGMATPEIRFEEFTWASGYYLPRGQRLDDYEHTGRGDVLVISTSHGARKATLAHEFRHMQQRYIPSLPRLGISRVLDFGTTHEDWMRAVRIFYRRPWELDALRFEAKHAPDQQNEASLRSIGSRGAFTDYED